MTGQRLDTEQVIRDWLADSAPRQAPASLRQTLEDATSRPPGHASPIPRVAGHRLILAGRLAAAVAILAVVGASAYLYGSQRTLPPAASASVQNSASPSGVPSSLPSSLPSGSPALGWHPAVDPGFPKLSASPLGWNQPLVHPLQSGGFVAFVPGAAGVEARVFRSADGVSWRELPPLPGEGATVSAVAESGGLTVAVGWTDVPMAWVTSDLQTWHATELPGGEAAGPFSVAVGPAGFLALGSSSTSTALWISTNGVGWRALTVSGLPAFINNSALFSTPTGYAIKGDSQSQFGRAMVWQSTDGASWTEAWQGPATSSMGASKETYLMGSIVPAPNGGYVSFYSVTIWPKDTLASPPDLLIWTSRDSIHWTLSGRTRIPGWMPQFAAVRGGLVGAGQAIAGSAG
ncbi:MAG: hypothetical protein ABSB75_05785, partial [Candidatus Limnocylindrales bacterium]